MTYAQRWRAGAAQIKPWLGAGIVIGAIPIVLLHDTNLITKLAGKPLPANLDPLRRVRGWRQTAAVVGAAGRARENAGLECPDCGPQGHQLPGFSHDG